MATWSLDPGSIHLNHGSFGATPVEVISEQDRFRRELESNPVSFMLETYQPALENARSAVAAFVHGAAEGLVFVPNATFGVNSVCRSLEPRIAPGAEMIVTNHGYNACNNAVSVSAERARSIQDRPEVVEPREEVTGGVASKTHPGGLVVYADRPTIKHPRD